MGDRVLGILQISGQQSAGPSTPDLDDYVFLRGSMAGAPPMYSRGPVQRILHFVAGIIFGVLAIGACLKLAGRW